MTLAIFDLDFTIIEGDCEWMWGEFLIEKGMVDEEFAAQMAAYFQDYDSGHLDIRAYQRDLLKPLAKISFEQLAVLMSEFMLRFNPLWRPAVLDRINWHRNQGHTLLLISATNSLLVEPIAGLLDFSDFICTRIEMIDAVPTGEIIGIPAFQEGKISNLDIWLKNNSISLDESWGYSDSRNDIPLLTKVENPVAVAPDLRLRKYALLKGWRVMDL